MPFVHKATVLALVSCVTTGCAEGVTRTYDARTAREIAGTTRVRFVDGPQAFDDPAKVRIEFQEGSRIPNEGVVRRNPSTTMMIGGALVTLVDGALMGTSAACQPDHGGLSIGPGGQGLCIGLLVELGASVALTGLIVFFAGLAKHAYVEPVVKF